MVERKKRKREAGGKGRKRTQEVQLGGKGEDDWVEDWRAGMLRRYGVYQEYQGERGEHRDCDCDCPGITGVCNTGEQERQGRGGGKGKGMKIGNPPMVYVRCSS